MVCSGVLVGAGKGGDGLDGRPARPGWTGRYPANSVGARPLNCADDFSRALWRLLRPALNQ
ncbi:hypothetical protein Y695_02605 [Hydrogenophaga sp. T4]|nr:hypothetical protein Y695_02605 [Hydrogenophaga sp. T4]